jgi:dipeptidyl aminopeptidase/acylaminoacyl peptidase
VGEPLVAEDLLRFQMVSDPQVAPDGTRVAFVQTRMDADANEQRANVWLVAADGSAPARQVTFGPRRDSRPRWSPDGRRLAFLSNRDRDWAADLYVLELEGGEPRCVCSLPRGIEDYTWSPDGSRFALLGKADYPDDEERPPAVGADERRKRYQERVRHIQRFRYRLDGKGQLDDETAQIWVCALEGGEPRMLTDGPFEIQRPRWAPGGGIAFLSNREPDHDRSTASEIYKVGGEGGEVTRLTSYGQPMVAFSFGPDGSLATLRPDGPDGLSGAGNQWLYIGDECRTRELDRSAYAMILADTTPGREPLDPIWAPDGKVVYFEIGDAGCCHLYRVPVKGGVPERVLGGRRIVGQPSLGGRVVAFVSTAPDDPASLRAVSLAGGAEILLHEPNPWVRERALAEMSHFQFELDGNCVDAWAILPPGLEEGERVPTLLYIHGGPHSAYGWSFHLIDQILAGAGYAIVECNPPGSQTYAESYAGVLRGAWGEMDFPYFMRLVDLAVEKGFADPERLGVGGASYGGYSTLWVVTHTDRFKAAVSMRPVANLTSFYGSSDVGWDFGPRSMGKEPWEDPELFRRLSPVTYLERVTTPLRLIGSTGDLRTPVEQAEQVFVGLRKMDKETDLIIFHGEPHALMVQGKPWNRVRHMRYVLDWFDRHLKGS